MQQVYVRGTGYQLDRKLGWNADTKRGGETVGSNPADFTSCDQGAWEMEALHSGVNRITVAGRWVQM